MSSDCGPRRATVEAGDSVDGMESLSRTQKWFCTLELVARLGKRPLRILVDSGLTGNHIDARECMERNLEVEKEETTKEL